MHRPFLLQLLSLAIPLVAICVSSSLPYCAQMGQAAQFELKGTVVSKTKYGFEIVTAKNERISITSSDATEFALRMNNPWFQKEYRKVGVDGKKLPDGSRERITYDLPKGQMYLLAQFRSPEQRDRLMAASPLRINNYLISDLPIEDAMPEDNSLVIAGKLDLETSQIRIGDQSMPITLGLRGATLRGRSIADLIPNETTVFVSGKRNANAYQADTVLFSIR